MPHNIRNNNEININVSRINGDALDSDVTTKYRCAFCEKQTYIHGNHKKYINIQTDKKHFYCNFCLRHYLHLKYGKRVLILSFRGIIGFYYYCLYRCSSPALYLSEIHDYIDLHEKIGNKNPLFSYDRDSFCWFVDFNRVGISNDKLPIDCVLETILEVLCAFNLYKYYPNEIQGNVLYARYSEAVKDFYNTSKRPDGKKILSPTLLKCGVAFTTHAKCSFEDTREFMPWHLTSTEKHR